MLLAIKTRKLVRFDPSIVTVKQSSFVIQIVSCRFYGAGSCWLRFSGVCSKLVNQLSKVSR